MDEVVERFTLKQIFKIWSKGRILIHIRLKEINILKRIKVSFVILVENINIKIFC